jgi:hypothetical protein
MEWILVQKKNNNNNKNLSFFLKKKKFVTAPQPMVTKFSNAKIIIINKKSYPKLTITYDLEKGKEKNP